MEDEDFLNELETDTPEVVEQQPEAAVAEPQPEPEPQPPVVEKVEEPKPEPQHVPITALLDERDKRRSLEQELQRLREAQKPVEQPARPDMFEDPEGYEAYQEQKVQQQIYQTNLQWSERIATVQHGEETVSQAKQWGFERCNNDPYFNAKVAASPDPYGFVIAEYKREQIASNVTPDDFAQFQAWRAAQTQLQADTKPVPQVPPRSIASAPSAGGILTEVTPSDEEIFAETFERK